MKTFHQRQVPLQERGNFFSLLSTDEVVQVRPIDIALSSINSVTEAEPTQASQPGTTEDTTSDSKSNDAGEESGGICDEPTKIPDESALQDDADTPVYTDEAEAARDESNPGPEESMVVQSMIQGFAGSLSSLAAFVVELLSLIDPIIFKYDGLRYAVLTICWALVVGFITSQAKDWADKI
mmetsp:Transcript_27311/g.59788  ORF Transcript_27311/g.59788 Transcript_27311/m.59788 type:complete len:181 (-) Transcript_27311:77-619(-)